MKAEFQDITEPFEYVYPETEVIGGVVYRHISGGVYQPEKPIPLKKEEFEQLTSQYCDLVFHVRKPRLYYDENAHEYLPVNPEEPYVIYFVNSQRMVLCDYSVHNYFVHQDEFEDVKELFTNNRFDEVCWLDWNEEDREKPRSGLCSFRKVDVNNTYQGYLKHIQINNKIGYLIEPGIYYFGGLTDEESLWKRGLVLQTYNSFEKETAVIAYATDFHPSFDMTVEYMAIGKENFARLKEIQHTLKDSFLYEFKVKSKTEKETSERLIQESRQAEQEIKPEAGAVEVLKGVGFEDVCLGYKYVFAEQNHLGIYKLAYILGNKLVLVKQSYEGLERREHDLRLLEELTVQKEQLLNCGKVLNRYVKVIDCKAEKERELLTREAYKLWKENRVMEEGD